MPPKLTTNKIIQKFIEVHGNRYDYSLFENNGSNIKSKIICPTHGLFERTPSEHKRGAGCQICKKEDLLKLSEKTILKEFDKVHGDKYDYSLFKYLGANIKSKIICKKHGVFKQTPSEHKGGAGCPKCARIRTKLEDLIKELNKVHNNFYDYSLLEETGNYTKIKIICPIHGVFEQSCYSHKKGIGCQKCRGLMSDTDTFIEKAKKTHGNKYDYSLTEYINNTTNVDIICPIHGVFSQNPYQHVKGNICPYCSKRKRIEEDVIEEFRKVHNDFYDYSLFKYIDSNTKSKIICPIHGVFEQKPSIHRKGSKCPKCAGQVDFKDVLIRFRKVHGNKYDYSLAEYNGMSEKIKIICPIHGVFEQTPANHLKGNNCLYCSGQYITKEQVLKEFKEVHGDKYDYSLFKYKSALKKSKIICPVHGVFEQTPSKHKNGQGCPKCCSLGFKRALPGTLYYLRIENEGRVAYKIGITNRNVYLRFEKDMEYITILKEWYYEDGEECYQEERRILKEFEYAKWNGPDLLKNGNSEIFDRDVLLLDN